MEPENPNPNRVKDGQTPMLNDDSDKIIREISAKWEKLKIILRSGCKCLVNSTTGESTECEVCRKARENIQ